MKKKSTGGLVLMILSIVLVLIGIATALVFTTNGFSRTSLFKLFRLFVSLLGPVLLLFVFVVLSKVIQQMHHEQVQTTKQLVAHGDKQQLQTDFYQLLAIFVERQAHLMSSSFMENLENETRQYMDSLKLIDTTGRRAATSDKTYLQLVNRYSKRNYRVATRHVSKQKSLLKTEIERDIEEAFQQAPATFFVYTQTFYSVVSLLNHQREAGLLKREEYLQYLTILRCQLTEEEYYLMSIYALFTTMGLPLAIELLGTNFFVDAHGTGEEDLADFFAAWHLPADSLRFSYYGSSRRAGIRARYQALSNKTINYLAFRKAE